MYVYTIYVYIYIYTYVCIYIYIMRRSVTEVGEEGLAKEENVDFAKPTSQTCEAQ